MKQLHAPTIAQIAAHDFIFVGGRSCNYDIHECLLMTYSGGYGRWELEVGVLGHFSNNVVKWHYLFPKNYDFQKYIHDFIKIKGMSYIKKDIDNTLKNTINVMRLKDLSKLNTQELVAVLTEYHENVTRLMNFAGLLRKVDHSVITVIGHNYPDQQISSKILREVAVPKQLSYSVQEEEALLEVAQHLEQNPNTDIQPLLKKVLKKFAWVVCGYGDEPARTLEVYTRIVTEAAQRNLATTRLASIKANHEADIQTKEQSIKSLPAKLRPVAKAAAESAYLKDHYKFNISQAIFRSSPIYTHLAKKLNITTDYLKTLTLAEVATIASGKPIDEAVRKERINNNIIFAWKDNWLQLTGKAADEFAAKYLSFDATVKELKGRPACVGQFTGKACVVQGTFEFKKIFQDCVLVVSNTSPDYVPILHRVKAIVAEEGGITAHVSVISRELRIPCIVGVKNALKIFKDGEQVEVNANIGTIKRI